MFGGEFCLGRMFGFGEAFLERETFSFGLMVLSHVYPCTTPYPITKDYKRAKKIFYPCDFKLDFTSDANFSIRTRLQLRLREEDGVGLGRGRLVGFRVCIRL